MTELTCTMTMVPGQALDTTVLEVWTPITLDPGGLPTQLQPVARVPLSQYYSCASLCLDMCLTKASTCVLLSPTMRSRDGNWSQYQCPLSALPLLERSFRRRCSSSLRERGACERFSILYLAGYDRHASHSCLALSQAPVGRLVAYFLKQGPAMCFPSSAVYPVANDNL